MKELNYIETTINDSNSIIDSKEIQELKKIQETTTKEDICSQIEQYFWQDIDKLLKDIVDKNNWNINKEILTQLWLWWNSENACILQLYLNAKTNSKLRIDWKIWKNTIKTIKKHLNIIDKNDWSNQPWNNIDIKGTNIAKTQILDRIKQSWSIENYKSLLYKKLNLSDTISFDTFSNGFHWYLNLLNWWKLKNPNYITLVDFSKPASEKRMVVINMKNEKVQLKTYCAHGKNSWNVWWVPNSFSNTNWSNKSSLWFYLISEIYDWKHWKSCRLDWLESSNSMARNRSIVMHWANYIWWWQWRRSEWCPAIPNNDMKQIVNLVNNGSCMYIHGNSPEYASNLVKPVDSLNT